MFLQPLFPARGKQSGDETGQLVAERKRAVHALRTSEEQLRVITDATPGLISYIDTNFRYHFINRQYERGSVVPAITFSANQ